MAVYRVPVRFRFLVCLGLVLGLLFCITGSAFALEDEANLPHVAKWVNGMAVTESGEYLSDTWARDDTGISSRVYVLLGQGCMEEMRIAEYPAGVTDGDTTPCAKYSVSLSLVPPEGSSGDVLVNIESDAASYSVLFLEENGYTSDVELYPGTYHIADIEVSTDLEGTYKVTNLSEIDASSENFLALEVEKDVDASSSDSNSPDGAGNDATGTDGATKNSKLLTDTIRLIVVSLVLLGILGIIKYRRAKAEEGQNG